MMQHPVFSIGSCTFEKGMTVEFLLVHMAFGEGKPTPGSRDKVEQEMGGGSCGPLQLRARSSTDPTVLVCGSPTGC